MAVYKLYYFNARGRAEATRLCFVVEGVKYEDVRLTMEEWQQKKQGWCGFGDLQREYSST